MKKIGILFVAVMFFGLLQWGYSETTNPQPGSAEDPLITKGYVDEQVSKQIMTRTEQIRTELNQMIAANVTQSVQTELLRQTGDLIRTELDKQIPAKVEQQVNQVIGEKSKFKLVAIPAGQTVMFSEGAEVIIRSGRASVFSPDSNGISDLTDGTDLKPGAVPVKNHLLLFPREGRGLTVAAGLKNGSAMMIKGNYTLPPAASPAPLPSATPQPSVQPAASAIPLNTGSNTTATGLLQ